MLVQKLLNRDKEEFNPTPPDTDGKELIKWCKKRQALVVRNGATGLRGWWIEKISGDIIEESALVLYYEIMQWRRSIGNMCTC